MLISDTNQLIANVVCTGHINTDFTREIGCVSMSLARPTNIFRGVFAKSGNPGTRERSYKRWGRTNKSFLRL